jgi:hypothetical protein
MIPAGYLAKRVSRKPEWLKAQHVADIYSVSGCTSKVFADYIEYWKHNGFWLFDSPEIILGIAQEKSIDLTGTSLFYYEVYEKEFDGAAWLPYGPDSSFKTCGVACRQTVGRLRRGYILEPQFTRMFTPFLQPPGTGTSHKSSLLIYFLREC